jgi:TolB protein
MKTDGTDVIQITSNKTVTTYASFSPDGTRIVYRKVIDSPGFNWDLSTNARNSEVFVLEIASGKQTNLSNNPAYDGWPAWSPDGRVVFASNRNGIPARSALYIVNADATALKQITDSKYSYNQHSISKDGKFILAERNAESFAGIDIIEFKE